MVRPLEAPTFLPAAAPVSAKEIQKQHNQIDISLAQRVANCLLKYFTAGIFYAVQNYRLQNALKTGDLETAESALSWGASTNLKGKDVVHLLDTKMVESVKFLIAQIPDDEEGTADPQRLRGLAREIISLRDDAAWGQETNNAMKELVPYSAFKQTTLEKRIFQERDLFDIDIEYYARIYQS